MEKCIKQIASKAKEVVDTFKECEKAYEKIFDDIDTVDPSRRRFEAIACRGRNRKKRK